MRWNFSILNSWSVCFFSPTAKEGRRWRSWDFLGRRSGGRTWCTPSEGSGSASPTALEFAKLVMFVGYFTHHVFDLLFQRVNLVLRITSFVGWIEREKKRGVWLSMNNFSNVFLNLEIFFMLMIWISIFIWFNFKIGEHSLSVIWIPNGKGFPKFTRWVNELFNQDQTTQFLSLYEIYEPADLNQTAQIRWLRECRIALTAVREPKSVSYIRVCTSGWLFW